MYGLHRPLDCRLRPHRRYQIGFLLNLIDSVGVRLCIRRRPHRRHQIGFLLNMVGQVGVGP